MPEGIISLGDWYEIQDTAIIAFIVGLYVTVVCIIIFCKGIDTTKGIIICALMLALGVSAMFGLYFIPREHGYNVLVTDTTHLPELVEQYKIVKIDGQVFKIKERTGNE